MRVPYTSRRKGPTKRSTPTVTAPPPPPVVQQTPIDEEDDDFNFIAIDELMDDSQQSTSSSSTSSLYPMVEQQQPSDADLAVSILEGFFFGARNVIHKSAVVVPPATNCTSSILSCQDLRTASPTSALLHPVCSCPNLHTSTGSSPVYLSTSVQHDSTNSLTASLQPPKRPALKQQQQQRPRSNSDLTNSKLNVSFTEISVREYDLELSDHPSCSYGPPIQLGWDYQETQKTSVEDYEVTRSPHRREVHDLVLSYNTRRRRLKQSGYRKSDIQRAQQEVDRIKRERLITEFFLPASAIDETLEKVVENVKGWFRPTTTRPNTPAVVCQIHSPRL